LERYESQTRPVSYQVEALLGHKNPQKPLVERFSPSAMNEMFYELVSYQVEALLGHKNPQKAFGGEASRGATPLFSLCPR
jgi:hypothetical protein